KILGAKALIWYPAEADVSIRPGWFYHPSQDSLVKSPQKLMDIYYGSVGRNCVLLLNVPPDKEGLINQHDIKHLMAWKKLVQETFSTNLAAGAVIRSPNGAHAKALLDHDNSTYWTTRGKDTTAVIEFNLQGSKTFDVLLLQEEIRVGQRIEKFELDYWNGQGWKEATAGTTVGYKRLLRFKPITTGKVRLTIASSRLNPMLAEFGLFKQAAASPAPVHWKMVWQDEFSKDGKPDSSKWTFAGRGRSDWNCYCADNDSTAWVNDGKLYLSGILSKEASDTAKYQTGCISTKGKFSFKYGKLEVRAKLPRGQGTWPAIWLLPATNAHGGWPAGGEIDVMEHLNFDSIFYQTIHSAYIDKLHHQDDPKHHGTATFKVGQFNVFGMQWSPDRIDLLINGKKTFSYPRIESDTTKTQWPFDQPFYILLDQALGGNWPGQVNKNDLPAKMVVDWVRVYQDRE
ncbi:MAG TPA: family 16 glycosylhydrolase, partial [Chitinophagaceae bacterium]|nr:family 16 glycosylhydrolase [Chitinophagaceae bacterium]